MITLVNEKIKYERKKVKEDKRIDQKRRERGVPTRKYLVEEWELEKGFVIFSGDGNYWLAFDYRDYTGNEPAVFYIEEDGEKPKKVAKNFEMFLKKLKEPEDDGFEYDEEYPVYTKEQFEELIKEHKSYVDIGTCFEQFAEEEGDIESFIELALKAIKFKHLDGLSYIIGQTVLTKLNRESKENWPIESLNRLAKELVHFIDIDGYPDGTTTKYGKKIQRKINS
ncbi:SMI1/KNR4 family protein [Bacillus sp. FJAT-42315]|uniref:SMI1/KNR4 family protein n=1 Tax=Bacillus sp. FJAT-42315 TaxID=2014077 RepID=UPI000C233977|nr:SMI1/KNR4 family protein [Bacillus sp. FJAT-42315]